MATINYVTLKVPEILFDYLETLQDTPHFRVCKYKLQKGVIFRLPNDLKPGVVCHCFIEHEVNLTNTLKTGTLTMKVQITFVPAHMGVFSGFQTLKGRHYTDEESWFEEERFVPDYQNSENIRNIVPLPVNVSTNLHQYLNEILFQYCDDAEAVSRYAVALGCQVENVQNHFVPAPVQTGNTPSGVRAHHKTIDFYNELTSGTMSLLPFPKANS